MTTARTRIRNALTSGRRLVGTFVKLPSPDVIELCKAAEFDFVVVDLEHSTLTESDAIALVRHADLCGIAALVRIPEINPPQICRLLENGATGFQLSMLNKAEHTRKLLQATRFAPLGTRSISMTNRAAGFGRHSLRAFLRADAEAPPVLVGQIETPVDEPWKPLISDLDVVFVGVTDLAVSLDVAPGSERLRAAVADISAAAARHGTAFGGWTPSLDAATAHGLADARYLVTGSDLQILATGLKTAAAQGAKE